LKFDAQNKLEKSKNASHKNLGAKNKLQKKTPKQNHAIKSKKSKNTSHKNLGAKNKLQKKVQQKKPCNTTRLNLFQKSYINENSLKWFLTQLKFDAQNKSEKSRKKHKP
jgi:hypothetical protein